jgi:hypothetical protein
MNQGHSNFAVVVLAQLLPCSQRVSFVATGGGTQRFFEPNDLLQFPAFDALKVPLFVELLSDALSGHPQPWG